MFGTAVNNAKAPSTLGKPSLSLNVERCGDVAVALLAYCDVSGTFLEAHAVVVDKLFLSPTITEWVCCGRYASVCHAFC